MSNYPLHLDTLIALTKKKTEQFSFSITLSKIDFVYRCLAYNKTTCNYIKTEVQTCICLMFNIKFPRSKLHKKSNWISAVLYKESKPSI